MNVEDLRQALKSKWLAYYRDNRKWLNRLGVWVTCDGKRRPSSSYILATLSILEPQLTQMFPLIVELSNNPDRIIEAIGLNFNPEEELKAIDRHSTQVATQEIAGMLPAGATPVSLEIPPHTGLITTAAMDEACEGVGVKRKTPHQTPLSR